LIKRWAPDRELIFVGDSSFAALDLLGLVSLTPETSLITRLRMDAELWDPAPERKPGQNGRSRVKGARRPSPKQRLDNPQTPWTKIGLRKFAAQAGIDSANLYHAISGKRRLTADMLAKLQSALIKIDD
jgi:hypothetical protein